MCIIETPSYAFPPDRELLLGLDISYAVQLGEEANLHGVGIQTHIRYGLSDAFSVAGRIGWHRRLTPSEENPDTTDILSFGAGVQYALDTLNVLPFFGALLGASLEFEDQIGTYFMLDAFGGADFYITQNFTMGLLLDYNFVVNDIGHVSRILVSVSLGWSFLL
jgi:hypothetical protein